MIGGAPKKLRLLLGDQWIWPVFGLLGLMLVGAALEMIGIGLIPVLVSQLVRSADGHASGFVAHIGSWLSFYDSVAAVAFALVALFLVKNTYLAWLASAQARFIYESQNRMAKRFFDAYMRAPWATSMQCNSTSVIAHTCFHSAEVADQVLRPCLVLLMELLVATAIGLLLVIWEPLISLFALFVLSASVVLFLKVVRRKLSLAGVRLDTSRSQMVKAAQDAAGGAKSVRAMGREEFISASFATASDVYSKAARMHFVAGEVPRLFVETAAVIGLIALVVVLQWQGRPLQSVVTTMALMAVALVRLIPCFNRVTVAATSLRYGLQALERLHTNLLALGFHPSADDHLGRLTFAGDIRVDGVSFQYFGESVPAIEQVSFDVRKGEVLGIMGPSGSGKTTLIDLVVGLLTPTCGRILIDGLDLAEVRFAWRLAVGYVPQDVYIADDTVRRNIAFALPDASIDEEQLRRAAEAAQLAPLIDDLPRGWETVVGERGVRLSGGQRQRIGIARALYGNPDVLVLDEATSALDADTEAYVLEEIRRLRGTRTMIIVAHRFSTLRECDRIVVLDRGRIVAVRARPVGGTEFSPARQVGIRV